MSANRTYRILIVEDESTIARRLARMTRDILGPQLDDTHLAVDLAGARDEIAAWGPDVVLLDLHLSGEDGLALLRDVAAGAFETIVISAHTSRALEGFEYGVRDFLPKPFSRERLETALLRALRPSGRGAAPLRYFGIRSRGAIEFVDVERVVFMRASEGGTELVLDGGQTVRHDKLLERMESVLPPQFERIHRSYIVDIRRIATLTAEEGTRYSVILRDGTRLPVGRTRIAALRERMG